MEDLTDLRCLSCSRLLFRHSLLHPGTFIEIACTRCGHLNILEGTTKQGIPEAVLIPDGQGGYGDT